MKIIDGNALGKPIREIEEKKDNRAILRDVTVRAKDAKKKSAKFVAATDNPVDTWLGPEILLMSGLDLERYEKNPVVLDAHDGSSVDNIVGRSDVTIGKHELDVEIFFAGTVRGENSWQLVDGDFLRTLSVGFMRRKYMEVDEGEEFESKKDDLIIKGPAIVVTSWELYEISVVPVPADADALKREYTSIQNSGGIGMTEEEKRKKAEADAKAALEAEARAQADAAAAAAPDADGPEPVIEPEPEPTEAEKTLAEERAKLETLKVVADQIRTITPESMKDFGDLLITQGKTLEEARTALQEKMAERMKPVGTGEPANSEKPPEKKQEIGGKEIREIFE